MANQEYIKVFGNGVILVNGIDKNECNSLYPWNNLKLMECNQDGM